MSHEARPYVLHEASYRQLLDYRPNLAVLVWGATEGHNYHLPHGTDVIEGTAIAEEAVKQAYEQGARPLLLPTVPYGNDNAQVNQVATITMRTSTQALVLRDIAESLVRQGIHRLVLMNFHGGNEFKSIIRDVMLDLPIFIVQVHGYMVAPYKDLLDDPSGDHANEFETCLTLHIAPKWVEPLETAADGRFTEFKLKSLHTPGVWTPRHWPALTESTGVGDPRAATAEKGKAIFDRLVAALVPIFVEVSNANDGDFPLIVPEGGWPSKPLPRR